MTQVSGTQPRLTPHTPPAPNHVAPTVPKSYNPHVVDLKSALLERERPQHLAKAAELAAVVRAATLRKSDVLDAKVRTLNMDREAAIKAAMDAEKSLPGVQADAMLAASQARQTAAELDAIVCVLVEEQTAVRKAAGVPDGDYRSVDAKIAKLRTALTELENSVATSKLADFALADARADSETAQAASVKADTDAQAAVAAIVQAISDHGHRAAACDAELMNMGDTDTERKAAVDAFLDYCQQHHLDRFLFNLHP